MQPLGITRENVKIQTENGLEGFKEQEGISKTNLKFKDGNLQRISSKADSLQGNSRMAIAGAGILGGIAAAVKIAAIAGMMAGAAATPIGWAAIGLAAVGLGILAVRHLYLKHQGMETDLLRQLGAATAIGVASFFSAAAIALVIIAACSDGGESSYSGGGSTGGGILDGWFSGYMVFLATQAPMDVITVADEIPSDSSKVKPAKPYYVYPGDTLQVRTDEEGHKSYKVISSLETPTERIDRERTEKREDAPKGGSQGTKKT
jgi:hypothetical protein